MVEPVFEIGRTDLIHRNPEPPRPLRGRFLHITDLHPDPLYKVGSAVSSGCHRNKPKKDKDRAGYLGTPYECAVSPRVCHPYLDPQRGGWLRRLIPISACHRDCDSPLLLTNYTLDYLEKHWVKDIDFVICATSVFYH